MNVLLGRQRVICATIDAAVLAYCHPEISAARPGTPVPLIPPKIHPTMLPKARPGIIWRRQSGEQRSLHLTDNVDARQLVTRPSLARVSNALIRIAASMSA